MNKIIEEIIFQEDTSAFGNELLNLLKAQLLTEEERKKFRRRDKNVLMRAINLLDDGLHYFLVQQDKMKVT